MAFAEQCAGHAQRVAQGQVFPKARNDKALKNQGFVV
jgi:hypothetical protein